MAAAGSVVLGRVAEPSVVNSVPIPRIKAMGRNKVIDDTDLQEILAIHDEFGVLQKDNGQLQTQVSKLHTEVQEIGSKQREISATVGDVERVVLDLGKQLSVISNVLQTLVKTTQSTQQADRPSSSQEVPKSPTLNQDHSQEQEARLEQLRKQLAAEKEKSKQLEELRLQNLPPIRVNRAEGPPGFANQGRQEQHSTVVTPTAARQQVHTPAFNQFYQQNRERQMWQGYHRNYEQDMQAQFMRALTKGPKMEFPKFSGEDPVGWIRQGNKYFQMAAAPEEYKVSLAQLYIVDEADVWLRRSGLLKKQLSWKQFGAEIVKRFSEQGSYDLTEKFTSLKQANNTVVAYTKQFEDLMAEVLEENPELGETWFIRCYVNGLRDGIKFQLRPLRPQSLTDAYCLAKEVEPNHPPISAMPKKNTSTFVNYYQKNTGAFQNKTNNNTVPVQQNTPAKQVEHNTNTFTKPRKVGECWRCGDKWVHGHKCKLIPNVHLLQTDSVEQETLEEEVLHQEQEEIPEEGD